MFTIIKEFPYSFKKRLLIYGLYAVSSVSVFIFILGKLGQPNASFVFILLSSLVFLYIYKKFISPLRKDGVFLLQDDKMDIDFSSFQGVVFFKDVKRIEFFYYYYTNSYGFIFELQKVIFMKIIKKDNEVIEFPSIVLSEESEQKNLVSEFKELKNKGTNIIFNEKLRAM